MEHCTIDTVTPSLVRSVSVHSPTEPRILNRLAQISAVLARAAVISHDSIKFDSRPDADGDIDRQSSIARLSSGLSDDRLCDQSCFLLEGVDQWRKAEPESPGKTGVETAYSTNAAPYRYSALKPWEIRLLELLPGSGQERLEGKLHTAMLTAVSNRMCAARGVRGLMEELLYTALSYLWVTLAKEQAMLLGNEQFPITANLEAALFALRAWLLTRLHTSGSTPSALTKVMLASAQNIYPK